MTLIPNVRLLVSTVAPPAIHVRYKQFRYRVREVILRTCNADTKYTHKNAETDTEKTTTRAVLGLMKVGTSINPKLSGRVLRPRANKALTAEKMSKHAKKTQISGWNHRLASFPLTLHTAFRANRSAYHQASQCTNTLSYAITTAQRYDTVVLCIPVQPAPALHLTVTVA